jgi:hypothetical protein
MIRLLSFESRRIFLLFACSLRLFVFEVKERAMNEDQIIRFQSDAEIESLALRFDTCELQPEQFPHGAHVALSVRHLMRLPEAEAISRIHDGLRRFVSNYNLKVYNETITLFWIKLLRRFVKDRFVKDRVAGASVKDAANEAIIRFGDPRIIFDYYTKALLLSEEARAGWAEPDLKPLDF